MLQLLLQLLPGHDARRHRRLMRQARPYRVADMPESTFGKLVGRARPAAGQRVLEAPLSGRLCVYYEAGVSWPRGTSWRRPPTEQRGIAFTLEDETGVAFVDPVDAFMSTAIDFTARTTFDELSPAQKALLERLKISSWDAAGMRRFQFDEAIIEVDERIAVFGGGVREPDRHAAEEATYRGGAATRLSLTGTATFPLFISDDPAALR